MTSNNESTNTDKNPTEQGGNRNLKKRFTHSIENSSIPRDQVFELREERVGSGNDKKSQFQDTLRALTLHVQMHLPPKQGRRIILHMLQNNKNGYEDIRPPELTTGKL